MSLSIDNGNVSFMTLQKNIVFINWVNGTYNSLWGVWVEQHAPHTKVILVLRKIA